MVFKRFAFIFCSYPPDGGQLLNHIFGGLCCLPMCVYYRV
nr:MAG TPA: hypothetical protein [Caudoviricetes sp.]